jgi:hypothetical protein
MGEVVRYALEDGSEVRFEIDPVDGFAEASGDRVLGRVKAAVGPAVRAAREVLEQVRAHGPQEVEVKFGIKVSGRMDWLVAKAASEANFEVTLKWQPGGVNESGAAAGEAGRS